MNLVYFKDITSFFETLLLASKAKKSYSEQTKLTKPTHTTYCKLILPFNQIHKVLPTVCDDCFRHCDTYNA